MYGNFKFKEVLFPVTLKHSIIIPFQHFLYILQGGDFLLLSDVNNLEWKKNIRSLRIMDTVSIFCAGDGALSQFWIQLVESVTGAAAEIGVEGEACLARTAECNYVSKIA